jgi:hypothetical protein
MPYVVPSFPLLANIWQDWKAATPVYATPFLRNQPCNLSPGKRVFLTYTNPVNNPQGTNCCAFPMELLIGKLTDVRCGSTTGGPDLIEVPANSKRFYQVAYVDDIGKGFANEHRLVIMYMVNAAVVFTLATYNCPPHPLP